MKNKFKLKRHLKKDGYSMNTNKIKTYLSKSLIIIFLVSILLNIFIGKTYAEEAAFTSRYYVYESGGKIYIKVNTWITNPSRVQTHLNSHSEDGSNYYLVTNGSANPSGGYKYIGGHRFTSSTDTSVHSFSTDVTYQWKSTSTFIKGSATTPSKTEYSTYVNFSSDSYIIHQAYMFGAWMHYSNIFTDINEFNNGNAYLTNLQDLNTPQYKINNGSWTDLSSSSTNFYFSDYNDGDTIYYRTVSSLGLISPEVSYTVHGPYTLTIDPNGGTMHNGNSTTTSSFTTGFIYGRKTYMGNYSNGFYPNNAPTREGYTFTGWTFSNGSGGLNSSGNSFYFGDNASSGSAANTNTYIFNGDYAGNVTATANWSPNTYTLTINPNGGTMHNGDTTTTSSFTTKFVYERKTYIGNILSSGSFYPNNTPTKEGYIFDGWTFSNGSGGLNSNGDNFYFSDSGSYASTTNTYIFNGDYAGNVTVTAKWKKPNFTLTVDLNGGTIDKNSYVGGVGFVTTAVSENYTRQFSYNTAFVISAVNNDDMSALKGYGVYSPPYKEGYTFTGWKITSGGGSVETGTYYGKNIYKFDGKYYGDVTVQAQWTPNKYTLTIDPNGGTMRNGSSKTTSSFTTGFIYGRKTYMGNLTSSGGYYSNNTPTRTGYTFTGWTFSHGSGGLNSSGNSFYFSDNASSGSAATTNTYIFNGDYAGNVTVTAQWTPITYKVRYNGNGATGGSMADSTFTYDVSANLRDLGYTKTGYTFMGWATSASGTVKYANKASVKNLSSTNGATVTLYAVWKDITPPAFSNTDGIAITPSGWTKGNAVVTSEAADTGSGMNIVTIYKSNGTQVATGVSKATYTQTAEGIVTYYATAKDKAGNISTSVNKTAYVDKSAPTLNIAANPSGWTKGSVTISVTATDSLSGVNRIELYNGSGTLVKTVYGSASTSTLTLEYTDTTEGTEKYTAKSFDNVTNTSSINVTTYIDKTKPEAVITTPEGGNIKLNDNTNSTEEITYDWTNKDVTFKVTTSDGYVRTTVNASYATDTGYL